MSAPDPPPTQPAAPPAALDWKTLIAAGVAERPPEIKAVTFGDVLGSFSRPVRLTCSDGNIYVIKGRQKGRGNDLNRALVNEHVAGRLAVLLGTAVPPVALVNVTELKAAEPKMNFLEDGVAHGSRYMADTTDRQGIDHIHLVDNRPRFASLSVLYSWLYSNDHQLIYGTKSPHLVYSVDHGHFLGNGGPVWDAAALQGRADAKMDSFFDACALTDIEMRAARTALGGVTNEQIAAAVAGPLDEWGITLEERVALAEYLSKRKSKLVALWTPAQP